MTKTQTGLKLVSLSAESLSTNFINIDKYYQN